MAMGGRKRPAPLCFDRQWNWFKSNDNYAHGSLYLGAKMSSFLSGVFLVIKKVEPAIKTACGLFNVGVVACENVCVLLKIFNDIKSSVG